MKLAFLIGVLSTSFFGLSQLQTTVIQHDAVQGKDAMVYSINSTGIYGNMDRYYVYANGSIGDKRRALTEIDILGNIPSNAIIIDAVYTNPLYGNNTAWIYGAPGDVKFKMIDSPWIETTVNWVTKPTTMTTGELVFTGQSTAVHSFNVTDHVRKWVEEGYPNYGWEISLVNEAPSSITGYLYASSDYVYPNTPKLTISYYLPIDFNGTTVHCTEQNNDGSISLYNITGGSGNNTIKWYNSSEAQIGTGNSISNLAPGFYIAKIEDNVNSKCDRIKYFLVGRECEVTNVSIQTSENFTSDIHATSGNPYNNYPTTTYGYAGFMSNKYFDFYIRYDFGGLDDIIPVSSSMTLKRHYHIGFANEDQLFFERRGFYWNENTATTAWINNNSTSVLSSHEFIQNPTYTWKADISTAFDDYVQNPLQDFNFKFTRVNNAPMQIENAYGIKTSNNSQSLRPNLEISFEVSCPPYAFAEMKDKLDGSFYQSVGDVFQFVYQEEYENNQIQFQILDWDNELVADQDDFNIGPIHFGRNEIILDLLTNQGGICLANGVYTIIATNPKGDKSFLRFVHNSSTCP